MMVKCFPSIVCQGHIHHPLVLLAALPANISLFFQAVHIDGQGAHGNMQFLGDHGHIAGGLNTDGFYNMHVIVGDILKFLRNNRLAFHVHHMVEQIHQQFIQRTFPVLRHLSACTFFPTSCPLVALRVSSILIYQLSGKSQPSHYHFITHAP